MYRSFERKSLANVIDIFQAANLTSLKEFSHRSEQLAIVQRSVPEECDAFFKKLMATPFAITGKISRTTALTDIRDILEGEIAGEVSSDPFYEHWLSDMTNVCETFCDIENTDALSFWLGSQRGCRRYHVDNVPRRMLVTYAGQGTEWLPDEAADRNAFAAGEPNEKIVKDESALQFLNQWDVAVFRGGPKGLLHRTPDAALSGPSILMRLDHPSFLENILRHQTTA